MDTAILGFILLFALASVQAEDYRSRPLRGNAPYSGVPSVHYRETEADRSLRNNPPPPRFINPNRPDNYYQQFPQGGYESSAYGGGQYPANPYAPDNYQQPPVLRLEEVRPRRPPEFVDFSDEFSRIVKEFVDVQAQKNQGSFVVKDNRDGQYLYLKFAQIYKDRIMRLSPTEVFGCVAFASAKDSTVTVDLDFYLSNEDWEWKVSKLLIHKVNGQARFHYNSEHRIVALNAPAAVSKKTATATVPKPKAPAQLSVQVAFQESSGNNVLAAGDKGALKVTVTNAGSGPAYAVRVVPALQADVPGLTMPEEVLMGDLAAGKSASIQVPLEAASDLRSQKARIKISVNEGNGFDADPSLIEFETRAVKPPRLEIAGVKLGGSGVIKAGEPTTAVVTIRNTGAGAAQKVVATLSLGSGDIFMSGEPSVDLGVLGPRQSKTANFEFFVNKRYHAEGPLPVSVALNESRGKYGLAAQSLNLVLGQPAPTLQLVTVKANTQAESETAAMEEDVDSPPRIKMKVNPEAYAVVVGIEKYRDVPAVDFAARDAQTVYDYLTGAMGFDAKNVIHLENERATRTDLATYLGPWLKDRVTQKSRVLIYYSGHGAPNPTTGEGYLIPYDGNPNYTETKAFALKQLYDNLSQLSTKNITVVLDSCFSGAGGRSLLAKGTRPLVNLKLAAAGEGVVVISASGGEQISTYYPEMQHGMLTYFFLKGLRGEADSNRDNRVTTFELFEYLKPAVEREARKQHVEQSPAILPSPEALGQKAGQVWIELK